MNRTLLCLFSVAPRALQLRAINFVLRRKGWGDTVRILDWQLDKSNRSLDLTVWLDGESESLRVSAHGCEMTRTSGGGEVLRFGQVRVSKAWMQKMADEFTKDGIALSGEAADICRKLLG